MAINDAWNDVTRTAGTALILGGIGYAGYKGYRETVSSRIERAAGFIQRNTGAEFKSLKAITRSNREFQVEQLSRSFDAMSEVMSSKGQAEFLRKALGRAAYSTRMLGEIERESVIDDILSSGSDWKSFESKMIEHEAAIGGLENVHKQIRQLAGGSERGRRKQTTAELIMSLGERRLVGKSKGVGYTRSQFEPGAPSGFWNDIFPGNQKIQDATEMFQANIRGILPQQNQAAVRLEDAFRTEGLDLKVASGIKDISAGGDFRGGVMGSFKTNIPGVGDIDLDLFQLKFGSGTKGSVLNIPSVAEVADPLSRSSMSFVAADSTGKSFATMPKFAVPKASGPGVDIINAQEAINMMLFGDRDRGIEGLAQRLHKYQEEGKTIRDLSRDVGSQLSGLMHRIQGSQDLNLARLHAQSVVSLPELIRGEEVTPDKIDAFRRTLEESYPGMRVGPLSSPDAMSKSLHLGLYDAASESDVFGEFYPIEKRYLQRYRPYALSDKATAAAAENSIFGSLSRFDSLTQKPGMLKTGMPNLVGLFSLEGGKHLGEEEAILSRGVSDMLETRSTKTLKVRMGRDFGVGTVGQTLGDSELIGTDYITGETLQAEFRPGYIKQKILDVKQVGNVGFVDIETVRPAQEATKTFSPKAVYRFAREDKGVAKEAFYEMGANALRKGGLIESMLKKGDIEYLSSADVLKGGKADVLKQMTEAAWIIGHKRIGKVSDPSKLDSASRRSLYKFVKDSEYRRGLLGHIAKGGHEKGALNIGLDLMKLAHHWNFNKEELGAMGSLFFSKMSEDELATASKILGEAGMSPQELESIRKAKHALGFAQMNIGEYASERWKRSRMDPRALEELHNLQWGEAGKLLVRDLVRRIEPQQNYSELDKALKTLIGQDVDLGDDIKKISSVRAAKKALGKEGFIFSGNEEEFYVPGPDAKRMGIYYPSAGEKPVRESLRGKYEGYFNSLQEDRDLDPDLARHRLLKEVEMEWSKSTSIRGNLLGSEAQMARKWLPDTPEETLAKVLSPEDFMKYDDAFVVGLGREPANRIFDELLNSSATVDEKSFIRAQRDAFFRGEDVTGTLMRHPTHRPQSLMPARFRYIKNNPNGVLMPQISVKTRGEHGRVYDVSLAQGMKLDYDADRAYISFIGDKKTKVAVDELMNSTRYREQFLEGVQISTELQALTKETARIRGAQAGVTKFVQGIERLVGQKIETGPVSILVKKMRAAAAYGAADKAEFEAFDYLLAEFEESPISSKHGMNARKVKELLDEFVSGTGVDVDQGLKEVWNQIFDQQEITIAGRTFERDKQVARLGEMIDIAKEDKYFAAFEATTQRQASASKGRHLKEINDQQALKAIEYYESSKASELHMLTRQMRAGTGSVIEESRALTSQASDIGNAAIRAFKKNWKYPAMAVAAGIGISLLGSDDMSMPETSPNQSATQLGMQGPAQVNIPSPSTTRLVTAGGGTISGGYSGNMGMEMSSGRMRNATSFAAGTGSRITVKDNRNGITPQYIDKVQRERYY